MNKICLLIIDVQTALTNDHPADELLMIEHLQKLISICRKYHQEIIYVRHHDDELIINSPSWQIDQRIAPKENEKIFDKQYNSVFKDTNLDVYLKQKKIDRLIIVGLQSEYCINTSIQVAFELGYKVIIPKDTTTTFDNDYFKGKQLKEYFEEKIWRERFASVLEMDEVLKMIKDEIEYCFSYGKSDFEDARMIRQKVFVEEQGFENEFDDLDDCAYHLVLYKDKMPIAVGRMYPKNEKTMILGRIATLKTYRGQKIGSKIVNALENRAKELNYQTVELSAQQRAQQFYEKLYYRIDGEIYYDEWCPHVTMKKIL